MNLWEFVLCWTRTYSPRSSNWFVQSFGTIWFCGFFTTIQVRRLNFRSSEHSIDKIFGSQKSELNRTCTLQTITLLNKETKWLARLIFSSPWNRHRFTVCFILEWELEINILQKPVTFMYLLNCFFTYCLFYHYFIWSLPIVL